MGRYPQDITADGPDNIGRGRIVPTTSWDSILNSMVGGWAWRMTMDSIIACRIVGNRQHCDWKDDVFSS
jgi:hypothetical protein